MLSTTAELVAAARESGTGVAAFNVITLEHAEAVATAAERTGLPAILQISHNAVRYHGGVTPLAAAVAALAADSTARLSLHLDHVEDLALLHRTADCGASSVMFDASRLPDDENLAATRAAAAWAHARGLFVEAELGEIGGKGSAHTPGVRTDPAQAAAFAAATGVDALAVAVGSSHAMLSRTARIDLGLIARLRDAVPVPLVLHGSSGIPHTALRDAVGHGMTKINIGTLLNIAFTGAVRRVLGENPALVDPRRYLASAREATATAVAECLRAVAGEAAHRVKEPTT
ncbi:class II fructose-bisphosphate aldolase [Streptomyces paludis]|uniref:Fructose-bisphosphate aldolase n=1 Tax=Streptomyces paludis TaxID=2282738 RepID=A0A345HX37_9ACTN|nr:class II fructose-bisphosphate aldolase [Streptomyces paludis]AXG81261.1 fructose-bisphosphate aldolase [Streptomyces paludis]